MIFLINADQGRGGVFPRSWRLGIRRQSQRRQKRERDNGNDLERTRIISSLIPTWVDIPIRIYLIFCSTISPRHLPRLGTSLGIITRRLWCWLQFLLYERNSPSRPGCFPMGRQQNLPLRHDFQIITRPLPRIRVIRSRLQGDQGGEETMHIT